MPGAEPPWRSWRMGRRVGRTIYLQAGPEPSDDDVLIGVMDSVAFAAIVVEAVNARAEQLYPDEP